jgi:hypothetical protein
MRAPGQERGQPAVGAPDKVAAQIGVGMVAGSALEPAKISGYCEPQPVSMRDQSGAGRGLTRCSASCFDTAPAGYSYAKRSMFVNVRPRQTASRLPVVYAHAVLVTPATARRTTPLVLQNGIHCRSSPVWTDRSLTCSPP